MSNNSNTKRVHITRVEDGPKRSVRDYLSYRPAPFQAPDCPTFGQGDYSAKYLEYVRLYRFYLLEMSRLREDFQAVYLEGGSFHADFNQGDLPEFTPGELTAAGMVSASLATKVQRANAWMTAQAPRRPQNAVPVVTVTPRPPPSLEAQLKAADLQRTRRINRNRRRNARRKAKRVQAQKNLPLQKTEELKAQITLAKAEEGWSKVQSRAEKQRARKEKREAKDANNTIPAQRPAAGDPAQSGGPRPNRAERRRAIYGPPRPVS